MYAGGAGQAHRDARDVRAGPDAQRLHRRRAVPSRAADRTARRLNRAVRQAVQMGPQPAMAGMVRMRTAANSMAGVVRQGRNQPRRVAWNSEDSAKKEGGRV